MIRLVNILWWVSGKNGIGCLTTRVTLFCHNSDCRFLRHMKPFDRLRMTPSIVWKKMLRLGIASWKAKMSLCLRNWDRPLQPIFCPPAELRICSLSPQFMDLLSGSLFYLVLCCPAPFQGNNLGLFRAEYFPHSSGWLDVAKLSASFCSWFFILGQERIVMRDCSTSISGRSWCSLLLMSISWNHELQRYQRSWFCAWLKFTKLDFPVIVCLYKNRWLKFSNLELPVIVCLLLQK